MKQTPQKNNALGQGITGRFVLHAVRYWWKTALPIGILLAAAGGFAVFLISQSQYEAVAWLRIDEKPTYVAFEARNDERSSGFVNTQLELLRSPLVLNSVVHEPDIADIPEIQGRRDAATWLAKQLSIKPVGQSELYKVSLTTSRPEHSVRIVDAVVNAYFALRSRDEAGRVDQVIKLLEQERERRAREVVVLRESLHELGKHATGQDSGGLDATSDPAAKSSLAELEGRLINAEVEREVLKARIKAGEESYSAQPIEASEWMVAKSVEQDAEVQKFKTALAGKQASLREIEARSATGDRDPLYHRMQREIRQDEQALQRLLKDARGRVQVEAATAAGKKLADELTTLRSELEGRRAAEQLLRDRYNGQLKELKLPDSGRLELASKRAELDRAEKVLDLIAERAAKLGTEQRAPGRVSLLQRAEIASVEIFPVREATLAVLAGLCLPFALAVGWEWLVRRVNGPESLEKQSHLALLAEVPRLSARAIAARRHPSRRIGQQLRMFEESVDILRTGLFLSDGRQDMKTLAVTSAVAGEGKTSVAVQLAVSMARATGEPTLLIDGDMRSPSIHRLFDVSVEPGLAQVLAAECSLEEAVVATWSDRVDLLPAGKLVASPHSLLGTASLRLLLEKAAVRYRHIVLDTPPLLAAGEALVLAKAADACLICTMRDVSRVGQVAKACERLEAAGVRLAGTVLNGVSAKEYAYRYGSYAYGQQ